MFYKTISGIYLENVEYNVKPKNSLPLRAMKAFRRTIFDLIKLLLFWVIVFDFERILFSLHNWDKLEGVSFGEWLLAFVHSFRLDLATAAALSALPFLILSLRFVITGKWVNRMFFIILAIEVLANAFIHSGEINAYTEWNHKLTTRVFMHLANPDEVFRTADYGMTAWFFVFSFIEVLFAWRLYKYLFKPEFQLAGIAWYKRLPSAIGIFAFFGGCLFLLLRGGVQQIPLNIDSAYYSNNHVANDISVNSLYYFSKSYLLYNRSEIDEFIPVLDSNKANQIVNDLYDYPKENKVRIFNQDQPNFVFVILEGWAADAVSCLSETENSTPNFDEMAKSGLLFTNLHACGGTSEIGNSSIFSGYPALPEISISMQPEKHRKIHTINQDFKEKGYNSNYLFSGDLKYGNIGGYFMDHGFDRVEDEKVFSSDLPKGKLNYYDSELFKLLLSRINETKTPFLYAAFTGSTHSPYDYPRAEKERFSGAESDYMNSIVYADQCIADFMSNAKKESWYKNTVFIFVSDHGHPSPLNQNPSTTAYFRIPFLIYGEPLKEEFRGVQNNKIASQADIAATIVNQIGGDMNNYPWSKDLLNTNCPEFALHTVNRGYGWVSDKGNLVYHFDRKQYLENTFNGNKSEEMKCNAFLNRFYANYKEL